MTIKEGAVGANAKEEMSREEEGCHRVKWK